MNLDGREESHIDIYPDRSILHQNGTITIFREGTQNSSAKKRYEIISKKLKEGYLEAQYDIARNSDFKTELNVEKRKVIDKLVDGETSELGRAIVGLSFLQLTVKSISPEQCIRLHKGASKKGSYSWEDGISLRTLDKDYNTPFLRSKNLVKLNADGVMMTRTLAENYPYSRLYKAEIRGPVDAWKDLIESLEDNSLDALSGLQYMIFKMIQRSEKESDLADKTLTALNGCNFSDFDSIKQLICSFFSNTYHSARAFEISIHSFMQAYKEQGLTELELAPLSQMRTANKKHKNVGDIELCDGKSIIESWDAKFGKLDLYDELKELQDKLESHHGVQVAGFITDLTPIRRRDVTDLAANVSAISGADVFIYSFDEWIDVKLNSSNNNDRLAFGKIWIKDLVETLAQKRRDIAPMDEPPFEWLTTIRNLLESFSNPSLTLTE